MPSSPSDAETSSTPEGQKGMAEYTLGLLNATDSLSSLVANEEEAFLTERKTSSSSSLSLQGSLEDDLPVQILDLSFPPSRSTTLTLRYATIDTMVALTIAFLINSTILIVGAAAFWSRGATDVQELQDAYHALALYVGQGAATLFAVALLASGQSSTVTGTMAGQIVMSGFLDIRLRPVFRRLVTRLLAILPAILTILIAGDDKLNDLIVLSQVVLSFQLPFAIVPLVYFTSRRQFMGSYANGTIICVISSLCAVFVIGLNVILVMDPIQKMLQGE